MPFLLALFLFFWLRLGGFLSGLFLLLLSFLRITMFRNGSCRVNGRMYNPSDFDIILMFRVEFFPVGKTLFASVRSVNE